MKQIKPQYNCSLELAMELVGGKWKLVLLWHLLSGTKRFSEIKRKLGDITQKMLTLQLRSWAVENHIIEGYGNGKFGPEDDISREQMATILYNYAKFKGYDVSKMTDLSRFTDSNKISVWASTPLAWANAEGLINGKGDGILDPGGNALRCEVAAILHRFEEKIVK